MLKIIYKLNNKMIQFQLEKCVFFLKYLICF